MRSIPTENQNKHGNFLGHSMIIYVWYIYHLHWVDVDVFIPLSTIQYIYICIKNQPAHFQITHIQNNSQNKHWHPTRKLYQKGRLRIIFHQFSGVNFQPWSFFKELIGPNTFSDGGRWRPNNSAWAVNKEICLPRTKCFLRRLYEVQGGWRSRLSSESSSVLGGKLLVTLWLNVVFNGCTLQRVFGIIKMQSPTDTNEAHTQQSFPSGFGAFCIGPLYGKSIHSCSG